MAAGARLLKGSSMKTTARKRYRVEPVLWRPGWLVREVDSFPPVSWFFDTKAVAQGVAKVLNWYALPKRCRKGVRP